MTGWPLPSSSLHGLSLSSLVSLRPPSLGRARLPLCREAQGTHVRPLFPSRTSAFPKLPDVCTPPGLCHVPSSGRSIPVLSSPFKIQLQNDLPSPEEHSRVITSPLLFHTSGSTADVGFIPAHGNGGNHDGGNNSSCPFPRARYCSNAFQCHPHNEPVVETYSHLAFSDDATGL